MSQPTPAERLAERLEHLPDACRDILAALDRARVQGGGVVIVRLETSAAGVVELELVQRYARGA